MRKLGMPPILISEPQYDSNHKVGTPAAYRTSAVPGLDLSGYGVYQGLANIFWNRNFCLIAAPVSSNNGEHTAVD